MELDAEIARNNQFQFLQWAKGMFKDPYRTPLLTHNKDIKVKGYIFEETFFGASCTLSARPTERGVREPPPKPKSRERDFEEANTRS